MVRSEMSVVATIGAVRFTTAPFRCTSFSRPIPMPKLPLITVREATLFVVLRIDTLISEAICPDFIGMSLFDLSAIARILRVKVLKSLRLVII